MQAQQLLGNKCCDTAEVVGHAAPDDPCNDIGPTYARDEGRECWRFENGCVQAGIMVATDTQCEQRCGTVMAVSAAEAFRAELQEISERFCSDYFLELRCVVHGVACNDVVVVCHEGECQADRVDEESAE